MVKVTFNAIFIKLIIAPPNHQVPRSSNANLAGNDAMKENMSIAPFNMNLKCPTQ
jgi:hypothetical protein